jgi:hypothetical protein
MDTEFVNELEREAHATRPVMRPIPRTLGGGTRSGRSTSEPAAAYRGTASSSTGDSVLTPEGGSRSPAWASTRRHEEELKVKDLPWKEQSSWYADASDGDEQGQKHVQWNGRDEQEKVKEMEEKEEAEGEGGGGGGSSSSFAHLGASFGQANKASSSSAAAACTASSEVDTWANTATCASDVASKFGVSF